MKHSVQIVENTDRFHVSQNHVPVCTFLFSTDTSVGVSKAFAQMNANSEAYKLCCKIAAAGDKFTILPQESK